MRLTVLPWLFYVLLVAILIAIPTKALAASYVMRTPTGDSVRLFDEPCPASSGWLKLRRAEMKYQGKDYKACWFVVGNHVFVMDEAGDTSAVPMQAFKQDVGA